MPATATSDARLFLLEEIAAVRPGSGAENVHAADEGVSIPFVIAATQVHAVPGRDRCGVAA